MKVGQRVRHKLSGDLLTIKRISGSVTTCIRDVPLKWRFYGMDMEISTAVCAIENLEPINEYQPTLF